jgi:dihydroorotate dehydrogenase
VSTYTLLKPLLFALDPAIAHEAAFAALSLPERSATVRALLARRYTVRSPELEVRAMGLTFPNPVGLAGGFDKDGRRPLSLAALGFGFLELGTVTAVAQEGNPKPSLFRLPRDRALVNRLGFPNRGAAALAERMRHAPRPPVPVAVSIGKSRVIDVEDTRAVIADYEASFDAVRDVADFVVVNVSSPNTPNLRAMQRAESAEILLSRLLARKGGKEVPILLKVAPDLDDESYAALLDVVRRVGADGVVATNTTISREGLATSRDEIERIGAGGLSGPVLFPRMLSMVRAAREALGTSATVIAVGGISTADHVREARAAGADLCQLYTGFVYGGPGIVRDVCRGLRAAG